MIYKAQNSEPANFSYRISVLDVHCALLREDLGITLRVRWSFLRDRSRCRAVAACRTEEV